MPYAFGRLEPKPEKPKPPVPLRPASTTHEHDYSPEEMEFLLAMDRYKREKGRQFPSWCEVLAVLRSLGYRKPEDDTVAR